MIKLIVSDLDGTLLNDKKELPPDFSDVLDMLGTIGVHFVAASGRSISSLRTVFGERTDDLDIICDNGAHVMIKGKTVSTSLLDGDKLSEMLDMLRTLDGTVPILCGVHGIYFENKSDIFLREAKNYYPVYTVVDDIRAVKDDIIKIAVRDELDPGTHSYAAVSERFGEYFTAAVTGPRWIDVMNKGINKGAALEKIQRELGITKAETMAFGDYFNDVEILNAAEYSFVMENAHPDMYKYGKYRAESNNGCGVTKAIKEFVLKTKIKFEK